MGSIFGQGLMYTYIVAVCASSSRKTHNENNEREIKKKFGENLINAVCMTLQ